MTVQIDMAFYEIHHYAMEELLYNFLLYVKLGFVYCTVKIYCTFSLRKGWVFFYF